MPPTDLDIGAVRRALAGGAIGCRISYHASLDSTMNEAKRLAERGCPEGAVVIAEEQTAGRGRFSRSWIAGAGGSLLLSVALRPDIEWMPFVNMAATLAVARAIEVLVEGPVTIKWPNDVRIGGRKVSGILVEADSSAARGGYAVVGIGVNVGMDVSAHPEIADIAASVCADANGPVERTPLLIDLLRRFDELYSAVREGRSLTEEWSARLDTLGRQVEAHWGNRVLAGLARGVDERGNLLLDRPDGSTLAVVGGEVTLAGTRPGTD